jgi:tRNA-dihydrouridine synthase
VPIIANGNIRTAHDIRQCLLDTGCDAVMSAEALLGNPALFALVDGGVDGGVLKESPAPAAPSPPASPAPTPTSLATEYIDLIIDYDPGDFLKVVKPHLFRILHGFLQLDPALLQQLMAARSIAACRAVVLNAVAMERTMDTDQVAHKRNASMSSTSLVARADHDGCAPSCS